VKYEHVDEITPDQLDAAFQGQTPPVGLPYDVVRSQILDEPDDYHMEAANYWCGRLKCRICSHEHKAVWPLTTKDESSLECEKCGHFASEPIKGAAV
jgi:hypothetical protein